MSAAPRFDLTGKIAVVTGGGGGLGTAAAIAFAQAGADIAVVARSRDKCEAAAEKVRAEGRRAAVVVADVTSQESVAAMVADVERALGPIDILFNNAGVTSPRSILDLPPEDWDRIVDVSLKGTFLCSRAVAPGMMQRRAGRIINMGSILSSRGIGNRAAYCAAKAGIANLTRAMAIEFGPHNITVNALAPTVIVTDLNRELVRTQPALYKGIIDRTPLGRLGNPEDILGALIFLASPAAAFITGQTLYVDGGYTAS
jgi:NAD(P)-dependent dehydrogenase (short-subunit alcohol dehydrogenase family)